jgi:AcrR family transcriptional regulator
MKTRNPEITRNQILNVAERHFAIYGYAGTSLRAIIKEAKVNIAAVAYHYGDKEELFKAVIERFAAPVVEEQLKQLQAAQAKWDPTESSKSGRPGSAGVPPASENLRAVLKSFYLPPLKLVQSKGEAGKTLALFLGRMQTEPEPVFSIVDRNFAQCRALFIDAFRKCLPDATEAQLHWKFEFMLSLIVCFLTRQAEIRKRYADNSEWIAEAAAEQMIGFCLSGFFF